MGLDTERVLSEERHYGSFVCLICQSVADLDALVTTTCSHVFCKSCLELWLLTKDKSREESREYQQLPSWIRQQLRNQSPMTCPTCQADLKYCNNNSSSTNNPNSSVRAVTLNKAATMMMNDISVYVQPLGLAQPLAHRVLQQVHVRCPFQQKHGCPWQGDYGDLQSHMLSDTAHEMAESCNSVTISTGAGAGGGGDEITTTKKQRTSNVVQGDHQTPGEAEAAVQKMKIGRTDNDNDVQAMECCEEKMQEEKDARANSHSQMQRQRQQLKQQIDLATSFKEEGNSKVAEQHYREAKDFYSKAIAILTKLQQQKLDVSLSLESSVTVPSVTPSPSYDNSETHCRQLFATIYSNRALCCLKLNQACLCVEDCRAAVQLDPTYAKVYLRGSKAFMELGKFRDACEFLMIGIEHSKAKASSSSTSTAASASLSSLRMLKKELGLNQKVLDLFNDATSCLLLSPERTTTIDSRYMGSQSTASETEQRYKEAKTKLTQIMTMYKCQAPPVVLAAAKAELGLGATDRALRMTLQILKEHPSNAEANAVRGQCLCYMGDFQSGLPFLKESLRLDPDHTLHQKIWKLCKHVFKYLEEARKAVFHRQFDQAIQSFTHALEKVVLPSKAPLYAELYAERGEAYLRLKKYREALKDAALAVYSREDHVAAWLVRAKALHGMDRFEEAREELKQLLIEGSWGASNAAIRRAYERADFEVRTRQRPDYYTLLGVPSVSSTMELKRRYKVLALQWHPDKVVSASEQDQKEAERKFKLLGEALEILCDDFQRKLYDEGYDQAAIRERVAERAAHFSGHGHHR
jgi:tetratricopeptide (TPR) repeat protein